MTKYFGFDPIQNGDVIIGLEKIRDMTEDIRPLHEAHYNETETSYLDAPFNPDYERYKRSEEAQQFVVFTVRKQNQMIGYLQYYVFRDMHAQDMYSAREDAFYISPEHRGRSYAPRLLQFAEHCLSQLGCRYVGMSSKAPSGGPDIGKFLERKGYVPVATYYTKQLEAEDNVLQRPAASQ